MKKFKIEKKYIREHIAPIGDYSPNHTNILKIVYRIEDGKEITECLPRDKSGYCSENINRYDILKAVRLNKTDKTNTEQCYYLVLNITPTELTTDDGHKTYRDAIQALEDIKNAEDIEEEVFSVIEDETPDTEEKTLEEIQELIKEAQETEPVTIKEDEDTKLLIDTYFTGFTFGEYELFSRALIYLLFDRDLIKNPLDFNKQEDYVNLGNQLIRLINANPDGKFGFWMNDTDKLYKDFKTYLFKIRGLNKWKVQEIARAIQDQESFKTMERIAIKIHRLKHPSLTDELETEEALEYIEKAV